MNKKLLTTVFALAGAAAITLLAGLGVLDRTGNTLSDLLCQRPSATDGEIVVVGMDKRAVDELGPMPWPRSYMAEVIERLNSTPETKPAVIGIDVLYAGESADPDADARLVSAAENGKNVVVAAAAVFGSELAAGEDSYYYDTRAVLGWDYPFDALSRAADVGHINAMADSDGIIRHALLNVEGVYSFARVIYERYAAFHGMEVNPPPETQSGFFYLPFTAGPGGYNDGVSFADILNGQIDPEYFAGKIVLIGPYAAGMQDEYRTAIDHAAPMYGVEIQANQIDAYLDCFYPRETGRAIQLALLFAASFAALVWFRERGVGWSVLAWALGCGLWVLLCAFSYRRQAVLNVLWVPVGISAAFLYSVSANYIRAARERARVTATFGRYVDPAVLKELLRQGGAAEALGGRLFDIAVLFVDIRGFTAMSEFMEPTEVVDILSRYLTLTTDCIMRNKGTLDKFVGDCTMAFWNAPVPQENAVYLACRAAVDMVEGSRSLGEELADRFGCSVAFGVGVHFGPAVVGTIGAPRRMDYTAIGDTVNTASRLESNAPGGSIYISRAVADALGDRAEVVSLGGSVRLKGKAEGFEVLRLEALR